MNKSHKQSEYILAVDADFINSYAAPGVSDDIFTDFVENVEAHLVVKQRDSLEHDPKYRQLIPYIVFYCEVDGEKKYFSYRRKEGGSEQRLVGKTSIGFCSHVIAKDIVFDFDSQLNLADTLKTAMNRAIHEETWSQSNKGQHWIVNVQPSDLFIREDSSEVSNVHFGVVYQLEVPSYIRFGCSKEEMMMMSAPLTAEELLTGESGLEPWARLLLERDFLNEF